MGFKADARRLASEKHSGKVHVEFGQRVKQRMQDYCLYRGGGVFYSSWVLFEGGRGFWGFFLLCTVVYSMLSPSGAKKTMCFTDVFTHFTGDKRSTSLWITRARWQEIGRKLGLQVNTALLADAELAPKKREALEKKEFLRVVLL